MTDREPTGPRITIRPRGRPTNPNKLSYEDAKKLMRDEMIPSRSKYDEWWVANKPKTLPRYPQRTYKEWVSWNDFLGNDNKFSDGVRKFRPHDEAMAWAHANAPKTFEEWKQLSKSGGLPDDIPARPDLSYHDWVSWNHFLGNKPKQLVEAKREIQKTTVFYIVQHLDVPSNVYTFLMDDGGVSAIKDRQEREKFKVVKMFWHDREQAVAVKQMIDACSSPYYGDERQRICPNIFNIVWNLQNMLETVVVR